MKPAAAVLTLIACLLLPSSGLGRGSGKHTLRQAFEAARYEIRAVEGSGGKEYAGFNPAQRMRARFTREGVRLTGANWETVWKLRSAGYGERQQGVGSGELRARGNRVELRRGAGITEWYVNGAGGLEQGFTLSGPPGKRMAEERLRLRLELAGDLDARAEAGGQVLKLVRRDGTEALRYDHLVVTDGEGRELRAEMKAERDGGEVWLEVEDSQAAWPITVDPTFTQQAYLKPFNTGAGDEFGFSVAISGDTAVVGAPLEDGSAKVVNGGDDNLAGEAGAAYVFVRNGTAWSQQAYLKAANGEAVDRFGWSVAIDGDTIVVGAVAESGGSSGVNGPDNNLAFVAGAAYVFVRSGTVWSQQAYLKASNPGANDQFGISVAVNGDTVVVGATGEDSSANTVNGPDNHLAIEAGAAYVFVRSGTNWSQQAYLKASNSQTGDLFGGSVAVSGDTVVVGARHEDSDATGVNGGDNNAAANSGAAYVYVRNGTVWSQQGYLKASNTGAGDRFGVAVRIAGDTVIVGADEEDSDATGINGGQGDAVAGVNYGAAYVFVRSAAAWSQQAYLKASNSGDDDRFGFAVGISGDTAVVGSPQEDGSATVVDGAADDLKFRAGAVYVYRRSGTVWSQQAYLKAANSGQSDFFGNAVAVSGKTVVSGARWEAGSATVVDGVDDNTRSKAGAAYIFELSNTPPAITPGVVTRQQGASGSALIAAVSDAEDTAGSLGVTVESANPHNGVTISGISNSAGNVTADVSAGCTASGASFTVRVTDSAGAWAEGSLRVTVTPSVPAANASVAAASLWPPNHNLVNVGLSAGATGNCSPTVQVTVYSNEDDQMPGSPPHSPDAKYAGNGTLRLRAERSGSGNGRVYLIVVKATNAGGNTGYAAATVVVPHSMSAADVNAVNAMAAAARSHALSNHGSPPPGYFAVGDGPVAGPKQ